MALHLLKGMTFQVILVLMIVGMMGSKVKSTEVSKHIKALARANNAFAVNLYQTLMKSHDGQNLFFSPMSISTALGMTHLGARGTSSEQISEVFCFNLLEESRLHESFKQLNSLLYGSAAKYTLKAANKLYGKMGEHFLQEFLDGMDNFYESAFEGIADFASPEARTKINDWVAKQTEGKISDLIPPGVLNSLTRLVLVNAIYFKGKWAKPFDAEETQPGPFKLPQEAIKLHMMMKSGKVQMTDDKTRRCFVLELPYEDKDLSMLAILPWDDDGLQHLEEQLSEEVLDFWDSDLEEESANILFPRFKLEDDFSLSSTLKSMGMGDPFDAAKANFAGITGDQSLHISEVLHKAFVEVNEEGSEAAAATVVTLSKRSLGKRYRLDFDHPFLFLIRDRRTKAVLFMGRMVDPPLDIRVNHDEL